MNKADDLILSEGAEEVSGLPIKASFNVESCEICTCTEYKLVPHWITRPMTVRCCAYCGHLYTSPALSENELREFLLTSFEGDPGAESSSPTLERLEQRTFVDAVEELERHTIPQVEEFVSVRGRKWLEFRFRTGALLELLSRLGATVSGADFFATNIDNFGTGHPGFDLHLVDPFHPFAGLDSDFDVISGLSIHVLSHLPSPRRFLHQIRDHLSEDGLILFDEKDVLKVSDSAQTLPLAYPNPAAHYHHFTIGRFRALVESSGFEIVHCDYSPRVSDLAHILLVGRRSEGVGEVRRVPPDLHPDEVISILSELHEPLQGVG